jgi:hypothetical protein
MGYVGSFIYLDSCAAQHYLIKIWRSDRASRWPGLGMTFGMDIVGVSLIEWRLLSKLPAFLIVEISAQPIHKLSCLHSEWRRIAWSKNKMVKGKINLAGED